MYGSGTKGSAPRCGRRRGAALVGVLVVTVGVSGLIAATTVITSSEILRSGRSLSELRADSLADAGVEHARQRLADAVSKYSVHDPLQGLSSMLGAGPLQLFDGEALESGGAAIGAYSATAEIESEDADGVTVKITATGYVPAAPADLAPGERLEAWSAREVTLRWEVAPSSVFDSAYFINNWGWFYGNTIRCNGNARSNGQFDVAGYRPTVTGQPTYESLDSSGSTANLLGYRDDNGDGLLDGNDGGIFSGWDVVSAGNVQGNGGNASNQHEFEDPVEMPNLTDMSTVEADAIAAGNSITIGGTTVTNGVWGDEAGELENLYLEGTAADPIELDGEVVVRGDVIISGYVTGQGAIYAGGNIYVPTSVQYVNGPSTTRPASNSEADTEAWITANASADFLGLFAREHIAVGDHTHWTWQHYVGNWMGSGLNVSSEDSGEDGVPNTYAGRDGIVGTADDDVLEGDGVFTTDFYTASDAALGLIPPGFAEGDRIPGTGEDIDGDGEFDDTTSLADIAFDDALDPSFWGGNMPPGGIASYSDIADLYATRLDATFYTNQSFSYVVLGGTVAEINGSIISRNENIVYGTPSIEMNYDCRLLGGNSGAAGALLPKVLQPVQVLRWRALVSDPHRSVLP